jgi:hypothetical protein
MSWLRSRRFYAGLAAGLIPFLFLAAQTPRGGNEDDGQRVVVRTYSACIPDSLAAQRTADLVEQLPKNAVLVENFQGNCCCCCCGTTECRETPRSDRTSFRMPGTAGSRPGVEVERLDMPPPAADFVAVTPRDPGMPFVQTSPGGIPAEPAIGGPRRAFFGLLAVPLFFLAGSWGTNRELPPGIICPDDSGLPTGPNRPNC